MILNLFRSKATNHAVDMRKHVQKMLNAQRDILTLAAVAAVQTAIADLSAVLKSKAGDEAIKKQSGVLESAANKWLKPYPYPAIRENVEVLLVALAVAMGVRTFFAQPFKIPTGSMQPTLFGVTTTNLIEHPEVQIPTGFARIKEWFQGVSYVQMKAKNEGTLDRVDAPVKLLIFNIKQTLVIGGVEHTLWFPPDFGGYPLQSPLRADLHYRQHYRQGDDVLRLKVWAGDHLFVDRLSYNFRKPSRGEIIVFETRGIERMSLDQQGQFYIKRMVVMGGEEARIGDDRHLVINGKRLDSSTPHFERVYSFDPNVPPLESHYSGHVNQTVAQKYGFPGEIAPLFPDANTPYLCPAGHFMVMGDNTMNSSDSRYWGDFTRTNVIGKYLFVYWPLSERFGWGAR